MSVLLNYTAPPTVAGFMRSQSFARFILGPVGSGKSTGSMMELLRRMQSQAPGPDGIRHTRFVLVRQTLKQIKDTALKEFDTWAAPIANFKVSESTIHFNFNDVRSEINLIPLDDENDQRRLLSMQITGAWINEFPEIDPALIDAIAGRCGRYPSSAQGGASWSGIVADGNFPTEGSPWHRIFEFNRPPDWDLWKQPSGLSEDAENLNWLNQTPQTLALPLDHPERLARGRAYYERLARGNSEDWIRRYVKAEYGNDPSGSAVYRESFRHGFHVVDNLEPVSGHPIIIGQDFGRDPWSIICQLDHKGRLLVLEEVAADDVGLELHLNRSLRPKLAQERYLGRAVVVIGDPAGNQRSTSYEETSFDLVRRAGLMAYPAPTNNIDARLRSVDAFLLAQRDGGPAILFDRERCPTLVRAMSGGYRYAKTRAGQLKPTPDKNQYSHPSDALQYACSAAHGGMVNYIAGKLQTGTRRREPGRRVSAASWT